MCTSINIYQTCTEILYKPIHVRIYTYSHIAIFVHRTMLSSKNHRILELMWEL